MRRAFAGFALVALAAVAACSRKNGSASNGIDARALDAIDDAAKRRACGLASGAPPLHEASSVQGECQKAVLRELASTPPSTVGFPGMFDEDGALASPDGCVTTYASWVNGEDSFGKAFHATYECTWDPRTGAAKVVVR